jgi:diguanylate cyclase (GGDEF)-like protein
MSSTTLHTGRGSHRPQALSRRPPVKMTNHVIRTERDQRRIRPITHEELISCLVEELELDARKARIVESAVEYFWGTIKETLRTKDEARELIQQNFFERLRHLEQTIDDLQKKLAMISEYFESQIREQRGMIKRDPLTGLYNFNWFVNDSVEALNRAELSASSWAAVIYMDARRFKGVNDRFGHAAGDEVICAIAEKLKKQIRRRKKDRPIDFVCRKGGDEYIIFMLNLKSHKVAVRIAQRIKDSIDAGIDYASIHPKLAARPVIMDTGVVSVRIGNRSVGRAMANLFLDWLHEADQVMYKAKQEQATRVYAKRLALNKRGHLVQWKSRPSRRKKAA